MFRSWSFLRVMNLGCTPNFLTHSGPTTLLKEPWEAPWNIFLLSIKQQWLSRVCDLSSFVKAQILFVFIVLSFKKHFSLFWKTSQDVESHRFEQCIGASLGFSYPVTDSVKFGGKISGQGCGDTTNLSKSK